MHLIARLNLAINEQNEKFWYGINDKVSMGGGVWERIGGEWGSVENLGEYEWWGNFW